jgi:hypothetical protein
MTPGTRATTKRMRLAVVWGLLAVLLVAIVAVERFGLGGAPDDGHGHASADAASRMLVRVPLERIGAVELLDQGTVHRFERDASGAWFYHGTHDRAAQAHEHRPDAALAKQIEAALVGFSRTRLERKLPGRDGVQQYGLAAPNLLIFAYRDKEALPFLQVAVGDVAPDTVSRYVIPMGNPWVMTIPNYQIDNLLALVKAAQQASSGPARADAS